MAKLAGLPEKVVQRAKVILKELEEENGVQYLTPVPKEVLTREETQEGSDIHAVLNGYISIGKVRCAAY